MDALRKITLAVATAGVLLSAAAAPAEAFTLSAPSPAASVAGANVDHVYWRYYHRYYYRPYYRPYYYRPYYHRHCWVNPWGHLRCGW